MVKFAPIGLDTVSDKIDGKSVLRVSMFTWAWAVVIVIVVLIGFVLGWLVFRTPDKKPDDKKGSDTMWGYRPMTASRQGVDDRPGFSGFLGGREPPVSNASNVALEQYYAGESSKPVESFGNRKQSSEVYLESVARGFS